jgi:hypothetical protein
VACTWAYGNKKSARKALPFSLVGGECVCSKQLRIDPDAPGAGELKEELLRFAVTATRTGIRYSGKTDGKDGLVMALMLSLQAGASEVLPRR